MPHPDTPTDPVPRRLLRVPEAADALAISEALAWKLVQSGQLGSVKIGAARRVPVAALDVFVEAAASGEAA